MTELAQKGIDNRKLRAIHVWKKFRALYNDPIHPLTAEEIIKKVKKKNGKQYTVRYVYTALSKLKELGI